jgi:RNA polymerase sigma-70 factor (ECF subfamily)
MWTSVVCVRRSQTLLQQAGLIYEAIQGFLPRVSAPAAVLRCTNGARMMRGTIRDDDALLSALREGDERVFSELVDRWSEVMFRLALSRVERRAVAEEVVQDAWLIVLRSLGRFERRSKFSTWVLGIVVNLARSRARTERRATPRSSESAPSVDQSRFLPSTHPRWPHHWAVEPAAWRTPEDELLAGETHTVILEAIDALPPAQREVILLRDVEGMSPTEVCNILALTDTHQRVLLHRARSRIRNALERYFAATEAT